MSKFHARPQSSKARRWNEQILSPATLDRYRKLASGAVGEAEQHQLLEDLAEEMNAFRRDARVAAVNRRSAFKESVGSHAVGQL